jgi:amino acid adenylation domain-containing protein/non-ribosomal peptide synthase protein (TIGR01720 family)
MSSLSERLAKLSPEKQALLMLRLQKQQDASAKHIAVNRRKDLTTHPISFAQQRLWFLAQFEPESFHYNIPGVMRIQGSLDISSLTWSLDQIVQRHEVMRAVFKTENGHPKQNISADVKFTLPVEDLTHLDAQIQWQEVERQAKTEAQAVFDLSTGPLFRGKILKLAGDDHILFVTLHHLISDGWSMGVFVKELKALYTGCVNGDREPLLPVEIQYADFAMWQRQLLDGGRKDQQLAYWKNQLAGSTPVIELPFDRPRLPVQTFSGKHLGFMFSKDITQQIRQLAAAENTTLFTVFLTAFAILLYRYSHQSDMCIGTPVANRNYYGTEDLIGFLANTLVLRLQMDDEMSFRSLLTAVNRVALEALDNQDIPFDLLVDQLQSERSLSINPLFQVMFDMQNSQIESFNLADLWVERIEFELEYSKFDLMLQVIDLQTEFKAVLEFNTDRFDTATIQRMAGHLKKLIEQIVLAPDQAIAFYDYISQEEKRQLLHEWNQTKRDFNSEETFQALFERQVDRTPGAIAVVAEDGALTFQELDQRANQLAHYLKTIIRKREDLVGVLFDRSIDQFVAILAVFKAGGAYLPLDAAYPRERLSFMLSDSQAVIVLSHKAHEYLLPDDLINVVFLDVDGDKFQTLPKTGPENINEGKDLAYVIYTSGSTGKPKGVMIQHNTMINLAYALYQRIFSIEEKKAATIGLRASFNAPICFDASVQQLIQLIFGHALYVVPQTVRQDGEALVKFIRDNQLDIVDCVPSQLKLMLEAGLFDAGCWQPKILMPGGEAIDELTWAAIKKADKTNVFNMYGPTECTVDSTTGWVRPHLDKVSIGLPVANAETYVLDPHRQPVPIGIPGELYIGGAGVGRGYLNREALTSERFVENPFGQNSKLYRTGDMVRYLPDGRLEFIGRIDHQVKVRGYRIELGEIEYVLKQHSQIKDIAVIVREDSPGTQLAAYYLSEDSQPINVSEILRFAKQKLPEYMVPGIFIKLEAFPLTPNGKLNRAALPKPEGARPELDAEYVEPQTVLEQWIAHIWRDALSLEKIGIHDNFFELGGDSIKVAVATNQMSEQFGVNISVKDIFLNPTISAFAGHCQQTYPKIVKACEKEIPESDQPRPGSKIIPLDRQQGNLPLSFAQQRLWFLDKLKPDSPFYNIGGAFKVTGYLDRHALQYSVDRLVQRHEVLRTVYLTEQGKAVLRINSEMKIPIEFIDIWELGPNLAETRARALVLESAKRPFNIGDGPLLRIQFIQTADEMGYLMFCIHHIVADGWSVGLMMNEIADVYRAKLLDEASHLPELAVQYLDYAAWQRNTIKDDVLEELLSFWRENLEGMEPLLELPWDYPRQPVQSFNGQIERFMIPEIIYDRIDSFCRQYDVTHFLFLLAVFQLLLYRYSNVPDFGVGIPIANRTRKDIESLVGFFTNTLVLRTRFADDQLFTDFLKQSKENFLQVSEHQEMPFDLLVDELQPERNLSYSSLFQVMFAYQNLSDQSFAMQGLALERYDIDMGMSKFDLSLSIEEKDGKFFGALEFSTDLFKTATIYRMINHFLVLIKEIVQLPNQKVSRIPILNEEERKTILVNWNQTGVAIPEDKCLHELIEEQTAWTPNAPAISYQGQLMTYEQLNRRANQLADWLGQFDIGPDKLIGIHLEKNPDVIVAILAVLKSGSAYVPLDPIYPKERLAYMVEDAQIAVLVSTSDLIGNLREYKGPVVLLDQDQTEIARCSTADRRVKVVSNHLAYVIYTSGSTGQPKGVLVEHKGVVNTALFYSRNFEITTDSRMLQFFSYGFDGSVADIFTALISGAALCMPDKETVIPGPNLTNFLKQEKVTHAIFTPSALNVLPVDDLPDLKYIMTGGESCSWDIVDRWKGGRKYINVYGPTEASVVVSTCRLDQISERSKSLPIGRPLANTQLYILDKHLEPVPVGVMGELHIGGKNLARGYLNKPKLTSERFIPNPYSTNSSARLYKTGDLVRYSPEGNIEFFGRSDHQVKVRGFRIELGEIESAIQKHSAIREAVVILNEGKFGDKRIIGYYVNETDQDISPNDLRSYLKDKLPEYMVPACFIVLERIPLTSNGKLDRKMLPEPDHSRPELENVFRAPKTEIEKALAEIWNELLQLDEVGVDDNFFELGGDSILVIQVIARANEKGMSLSPRQFFENPTIGGLAGVINKGETEQADQGVLEGYIPLTPIQQWFFEQDLPNPNFWNQSVLLEVLVPLDPITLKNMVTKLLEQHDALRMKYEFREGVWEQYYERLNGDAAISWKNFSTYPDDEVMEAMIDDIQKQQEGLDIVNGPVLRVAYYDLGNDQTGRLLMIAHHLVVDSVSWRIILEDLRSLLLQAQSHQVLSLPRKTSSFRQWARRVARFSTTERAKQLASYWLEMDQTKISHIPIDFNDGENLEAYENSVIVEFTQEETQILLQDIPRLFGMNVADVLLTAIGRAFAAWTNTKNVLIDIENHGRTDLFEELNLSRTVGWFTSVFPVLLQVSSSTEIRDWLYLTKDQLSQIPEQGFGFSVMRYLGPMAGFAYRLKNIQPQVVFNYLGQLDRMLNKDEFFDLAPELMGRERFSYGKRTHLLNISGSITQQKLKTVWAYSEKLHSRISIERLALRFAKVLREIVDYSKTVDEISYSPADFPDLELSQDDLEDLIKEVGEIS